MLLVNKMMDNHLNVITMMNDAIEVWDYRVEKIWILSRIRSSYFNGIRSICLSKPWLSVKNSVSAKCQFFLCNNMVDCYHCIFVSVVQTVDTKKLLLRTENFHDFVFRENSLTLGIGTFYTWHFHHKRPIVQLFYKGILFSFIILQYSLDNSFGDVKPRMHDSSFLHASENYWKFQISISKRWIFFCSKKFQFKILQAM